MKAQITAYSFMILLLAAHFSRANSNFLAIIALLIPFLLFIKKSWVIDLLQGVGGLAVVVWLYAAYQYVQLRIEARDDWVRLLFIIAAIALYSGWSSYFLRSEHVKETYGIKK